MKINFTFEFGPLAGKTLVRGLVSQDGVRFWYAENFVALKGITKKDVFARYATVPGLWEAVKTAERVEQLEQQVKATELARNVPGLEILKAAYRDRERYDRQFGAMMYDEGNDGACPPKLPVDAHSLEVQYPRAALYVRAECSRGGHWAKTKAGQEAMEILATGGTIENAKAKLENWMEDNKIMVD